MSEGVFSSEKFNKEKWIREANQTIHTTSSCYRGGMVNDLIKRILKPGLNRESVEELLGKPGTERQLVGQKGITTEYTVGMCSGFQMDYDTLNIQYDENNQGKISYHMQH